MCIVHACGVAEMGCCIAKYRVRLIDSAMREYFEAKLIRLSVAM
jgi:hypothetical protein